MMNITFLLGVLGGLILVIGAAWPEGEAAHPAKSIKNLLLAGGAFVLLIYSYLNYRSGGPIFFLFLQGMVNVSSVFMLLNIDDRIDTPIVAITCLLFIAWSLFLSQEITTIFFILGLAGIGIGYVLTTGTVKREVALAAGSLLIATFSYFTHTWIFFWLNVFFAIFSGYYVWKLSQKPMGKRKAK